MLPQWPARLGKGLQVALGPADALAQGDAQGDGLLVIEHGCIAVGDGIACSDGIGRKGAVLRQGGVVPAVFDQLRGEQEARALNARGQSEHRARAVFHAYGSQPVQGIGGGDPVVAEIFAGAAGRYDALACVKGLIHARDIVAVEQIVCVKYKIALKGIRSVVPRDAGEQIFQRVALCAVVRVAALIADRTAAARRLRRPVRAVVGHDKDREQLRRVVLQADALEQTADDGLLVARRNDDGIAVLPPCGCKAPCGEQTDDGVDGIIAAHRAEQGADGGKNFGQQMQHRRHFLFRTQNARLIIAQKVEKGNAARIKIL